MPFDNWIPLHPSNTASSTRSYYDHQYLHTPDDLLQERHRCNISQTPLCLRAGVSMCQDGYSYCYNGERGSVPQVVRDALYDRSIQRGQESLIKHRL